MRRKGFTILLWVVILVSFSAASASAAGYIIMEQSVRGLGTAFAGAAALAEDPSTIYFNPAGMIRLSGKRAEVGVHYINPKADYKDKGSTTVLGTPLTGCDGCDGGVEAYVPNLYYSHQLSENLVVGLGINAPFGLASEYDREWVGRYHAVESSLTTININPSVAGRINRMWAAGAGISLQYADATLSNKVDFGTIGQTALRGALGGTPQGDDGFVEIEGDGWAFGYNVGLLTEPIKGTRFGFAYRSSIRAKLDGKATYSYETPTARSIGTAINAVNGNANATVDLPETFSAAAYHEFTDKLAVVADVTFTNWDRFDEIRIKFGSGQRDGVTTTKWEDAWRYGLGLIYRVTDRFTGRVGAAYDETPVPNEERRTPRIPDEDRIWLAVGAGYKFFNNLELNVGYTHIIVDDPVVNKKTSLTDPTDEDNSRGNLTGEYDASVDIVSVNLTFTF